MYFYNKLKSKLLPEESGEKGPTSRNERGLEIPVVEGNVCKKVTLEPPSENRTGPNKVVHTKSGETNPGISQDVQTGVRKKANLPTPPLLISTTYDQNQIERLVSPQYKASDKCGTTSPNCDPQPSSPVSTASTNPIINSYHKVKSRYSAQSHSSSQSESNAIPGIDELTSSFTNLNLKPGNQKDKSISILPSEINERQTIERKLSQTNIRVGNTNIQSTSIEKANGQPLVNGDATQKFGADLHRSKKSADLTKAVESLISESELDKVSNHDSKQRDNHDEKRSDRFIWSSTPMSRMSRNAILPNNIEIPGKNANDMSGIPHIWKNPTQFAKPLRPNIEHNVPKIQPAEENVSIEISKNENENKSTKVSTSYKDLQAKMLSRRLAAEKQFLKAKSNQKEIPQPQSPSSVMLEMRKQQRKQKDLENYRQIKEKLAKYKPKFDNAKVMADFKLKEQHINEMRDGHVKKDEHSTSHSTQSVSDGKPQEPKYFQNLIGKYGLQEMVNEVENYNLTEEEKSTLWRYCVEEILTLFNDNTNVDKIDIENIELEIEMDIATVNTETTNHSELEIESTSTDVDLESGNLRSYEKKGFLRFFLNFDQLDDENENGNSDFSDSEVETKEEDLGDKNNENNNLIIADVSCNADQIDQTDTQEKDLNRKDEAINIAEVKLSEMENNVVVEVEIDKMEKDTGMKEGLCEVNNNDEETIGKESNLADDKGLQELVQNEDTVNKNDEDVVEVYDESILDSEKMDSQITQSIDDDAKVIRRRLPKEGKRTYTHKDLQKILQDLTELHTSILSDTKSSDVLQKPFSHEEDSDPMHTNYGILDEDVQSSLYRFDSDFHKYIEKSYSYENNMLDGSLQDDGEKSRNIEPRGEKDEVKKVNDFPSPPNYPSKDVLSVSGDVLLLQDMLGRVLGGDEKEQNSTFNENDTAYKKFLNDMNITPTCEFSTKSIKRGSIQSEMIRVRQNYETLKMDLIGLLDRHDNDMLQFQEKMKEIDSTMNEEDASDDEAPSECVNSEDEDGSCFSEITDGVSTNGDSVARSDSNTNTSLKPLRKVIMYDKSLKNQKNKLGFSLQDCLSAFEKFSWYPDRKIGILACDADCYIDNADLLYPYISKLHNGEVLQGSAFVSLNKRSLKALGSLDHFPNILDCTFDIRRSLANEKFPIAYENRKERQGVNNMLKTVFKSLKRNVDAPYAFSDKDIVELAKKGMIKLPPDERVLGGSSLYKESGGKLLVILNDKEHIRIICSSRSIDLKKDFEGIATFLKSLEVKLKEKNRNIAWDERFGYLNPSPEHLGMAFIISIRASLTCFDENMHVEEIISKFGLNISRIYDQKVKKMIYTVKNRYQFGSNELEVMKNVIQGVRILSDIDKRLESGKNIDDIIALM